MGANIRIETLGDIGRRNLDVAAVCTECGRTVVFEPQALASFLVDRGIRLQLTEVARHLRCRCRSRAVRIATVNPMHRPNPLPPPDRPAPLYIMPRGPKQRELAAAAAALARVQAEPESGDKSRWRIEARARLRAAERAWRDVLRSGVDI